MKKVYFLAAAAAAMLAGCLNDDNGNDNPEETGGGSKADLTSLTIRLGNMGVRTRSLEGKGKTDGGTNQLSNAHVFILDEAGTDVIDYAPVVVNSDLEAIKGAGWIFPDPIPTGSKVYVLGNVHGDYNRTVKDLATLEEINAFTSDIWTQTDYNLATMANEDGAPVDLVAATSGSARVSVEVAPVISRLELHSLQGGGNIRGFSVTGVFLTGYHTAYTYGGGFPAGSQPVDNTVELATNGGMTGDDLQYPAIAQGDPLRAEMTGNRIWAYNVAARSMPLLVVRLENVLIGGTLQAGPLYLTVSSYGGTTEFKAGKIYRINTLSFTEENLELAPVADGGITAEPTEWEFDELTPDISTPGAKIAIAAQLGAVNDWEATDTDATTQTFDVTLPSALTTWSVDINQGVNTYFVSTPGTGTFTIAPVGANTSVFERIATVKVNGEGDAGATGTSNLITVRQKAADAEMAASPTPLPLEFDAADDNTVGDDGDITFTSNVAFTVALTGTGAGHFTLTGQTVLAETPADGIDTYTINVVPVSNNTGGTGPITATVVITNTDGRVADPVEITVTHNN